MPQIQLPFDLLEKTLYFVDDRQSLVSCALSGRILRHSSQRLLFTSVEFSSSTEHIRGYNPLEQFCDAISTSSDLGQYVRILTVRAILLTDETIMCIFQKTLNLFDLTFAGETRGTVIGDTTAMPWWDLLPQTRNLILHTILPTLKTLRFRNLIGIPPVMFESFTPIRALDCTNDVLPLPEGYSPTIQDINERHPIQQVELQRGRLDAPIGDTPSENHLARHQYQLQEMAFGLYFIKKDEMKSRNSLRNLTNFLNPFKSTLKAVAFRVLESFIEYLEGDATDDHWFDRIFDLTKYTSLTTFIVDVNFNLANRERCDRYVQLLVRILQSGRPTAISPGLHIVCLNTNFHSFHHIVDQPASRQSAIWNPIVEALSDIPTLQMLFFNVCILVGGHDEMGWTYFESQQVLEEALETGGLLEKSRTCFNDPVYWNLSVHTRAEECWRDKTREMRHDAREAEKSRQLLTGNVPS
ncbi:hypothetical protein DL96DRAFT_1720707 [Flagelloscypha sp. PMI_526]|nr:hypothetical protein DL96DRAFT_1720707 [Flagelloscypha sp. PMI_526]